MFHRVGRSKGRPINIHAKPKRTQQMYAEDLQKIILMRKPGESVSDVISRIIKIYVARCEESECFKLWQEQCSKAKSLEEEMDKKVKRIAELENENGRFKQLINDCLSTQITKSTSITQHSTPDLPVGISFHNDMVADKKNDHPI